MTAEFLKTRNRARWGVHSIRTRLIRGILYVTVILGLSAALDGVGLSGLAPFAAESAQAGNENSELRLKKNWQDRYRRLLQNQARLRDNAAKSRENYSRARRRNYPRGGARQQFILDADEAERDLVKVEAETMELLEQARRDALPRNWVYEVEDENIQAPAATASDPDEPDDSREGRNPLYLDN